MRIPCCRSLVVGMSAALLSLAAAQAAPVSPRVESPSGPLLGVQTSRGSEFLGVPYAQPPVGERRWTPPAAVNAWTVLRDATRFAPRCVQASSGKLGTPDTSVTSEDCLYLNVYVPPGVRSGQQLPVMVWIHGGEFIKGAGSDYDGSVLAQRQRVIVVTMNYRLGALGFLATPSTHQDTGAVGNYGLLDQQAALRWVRSNIAAFGGDAANVTVFGESAGGMSVCAQLASPAADGLFQKAIVQSGLCNSPNNTLVREDAEQDGVEFARRLGCSDANLVCLRGQSAQTLMDAPIPGLRPLGALVWAPVYGVPLLPLPLGEAFRTGAVNRVPLLNGTNRDEGRLFIDLTRFSTGSALEFDAAAVLMFGPSRGYSAIQIYPDGQYPTPALAFSTLFTDAVFSCPAAHTDANLSALMPVYAYEFADPAAITTLAAPTDLGTLGAFHASEIAYIFQTANALADPATFTLQQRALSNRMQAIWGTFARTGRPVEDNASSWPAVTSTDLPVHVFTPGGDTSDLTFSARHHCQFWNTLPPA